MSGAADRDMAVGYTGRLAADRRRRRPSNTRRHRQRSPTPRYHNPLSRYRRQVQAARKVEWQRPDLGMGGGDLDAVASERDMAVRV